MKKILISITALMALSACGENRYYSSPSMRNASYEQDGYKMDKKVNAITERLFSEADINRDGYLSWKEFDSFLYKKFREADGNRDKLLSPGEVKNMKRQEMKSLHEQMREEKASERRDYDMNYSTDVSPGAANDNVYKDNNRY